MKLLLASTFFFFASLLSLSAGAQHIRITDGSLSVLKTDRTVNVSFTYDHMRVGKFDREDDYVSSKREEYNKKDPGHGDSWAKAWVDDRRNRFDPKFDELFEKYSEFGNNKDAKYTLLVHTVFTEPGFNVGVWKKNAEIDLEVWLVETANPGNVIAKMTVDKVPGRSFWGNDYDTGERISECYADGGKAIGKYIRDKAK